MTWVWLLVTGVSMSCESVLSSWLDVSQARAEAVVLDESGPVLAEIVSSCASALEEYAPDTDAVLLAVTRRDGRRAPVGDLLEAGLLVVEDTGGLGFTLGRGVVAMMIGNELVQVNKADPSVFVEAWRLPGFVYAGVR